MAFPEEAHQQHPADQIVLMALVLSVRELGILPWHFAMPASCWPSIPRAGCQPSSRPGGMSLAPRDDRQEPGAEAAYLEPGRYHADGQTDEPLVRMGRGPCGHTAAGSWFSRGIMVLNGKTEIGIVVASTSGLDRVLDPWRGLVAFVLSTPATKVQFDLIEGILGRKL